MRSKLGCFIFIMIIMTSQIFAGTVYYVDATGGNDYNGGTSEATAWKTIAKVNNSIFYPGDNILFKKGEVWREQLVIPSSGSASGGYITFGNYGTGDNPILHGEYTRPSSRGQGLIYLSGRDYIIIDGIDTDYSASHAVKIAWACDNIIVENSTHAYSYDGGICACGSGSGGSSNIIIRNNIVHHPNSAGDPAYHEGISVEYVNGFEISGNEVYSSYEEGIDAKYGSSNGSIHGNIVHDNRYENIIIDGATNVDVYQNLTYNMSRDAGIFIDIENNSYPTTNINIYYNLIWNNSKGIKFWVAGGITADFQNINIYNNTFYNCEIAILWHPGVEGNYSGTNYIKNNIIWCKDTWNYAIKDETTSGIGLSNTIIDFNAFQSTSNSDTLGNNYVITTDVKFSDAANNDFTLQADSPCIDAGTDVGLTKDYAGNTVPYGLGFDIGAYEYVGENPSINATANASPTSGEVPLTVNFTGNATGGMSPYSYSWDFGDGASSSEQNPSHTYSQASDYTVTLTVTDSETNQDSDSLIINVNAPAISLEASCAAFPTSGEVPLTVNFTGNASGGTPPYSYSWDFGDGTSSSEQIPTHTYSNADDYTVTLTVTDSESNQDSDSLIINANAAIPPYLSCSPKSLYFGATTSGDETTDQYLRIINAGGGTLTWNIEDDAGWLFCSPLSGTDRGEITVSVNASGLSLGLYIATITVSSPEVYNSPQYVSVSLRIYEPEQENPPFGSLGTPVNGSTVSGSIPITGWALDDIEVVRVEIKRNSDPLDPPEAIGSDGLVYIGDAVFVEGARPDVEKSYADYPLNSRAGWGYMLLTNDLPYRGNGSFTIYGFAYDAGGNREEIGRKTILCDNVNRVKPFGTIDTHEQGEIIRGSNYINFGWALTPLPKTIPKDGSTIWVWVDGVQVGHPVYDQYREDIATFYPEYNNAQGAVGYYYLDTTQYENGMHTITWSVMDDEGKADEIGARYFFIDNIETGSAYHGPLGLRTIYRENVEGRLRIRRKEVGKEYRPRVDSDRELNAESILNIQIEEMEPLRIVLEESSSGKMKYIGWGENKWKALPIGSTLDREKGIFSWIPTPGFIGKYVFHFAITDGSYMSKPLRVEVNVIPKSCERELIREISDFLLSKRINHKNL